MFIFENITASLFVFFCEIFHWKIAELIEICELLLLSHKYSWWKKKKIELEDPPSVLEFSS